MDRNYDTLLAMSDSKQFCTVLNCMDGRIQKPVLAFLSNYYKAEYVDNITDAGIVKVLSQKHIPSLFDAIMEKVKISIEKHDSVGLAIVAHEHCAGNPITKELQLQDLQQAKKNVAEKFPSLPIQLLWLGETWEVEVV